jgi:hypothetical protein
MNFMKTNLKIFLISSFILILLSSCYKSEDYGKETIITGMIIERVSQCPIRNTKITIGKSYDVGEHVNDNIGDCVTDSNGIFSYKVIENNDYLISYYFVIVLPSKYYKIEYSPITRDDIISHDTVERKVVFIEAGELNLIINNSKPYNDSDKIYGFIMDNGDLAGKNSFLSLKDVDYKGINVNDTLHCKVIGDTLIKIKYKTLKNNKTNEFMDSIFVGNFLKKDYMLNY